MVPNISNPLPGKSQEAQAKFTRLIYRAGAQAETGQDGKVLNTLVAAKRLAETFGIPFDRRAAAKLLVIATGRCSTHCTVSRDLLVRKLRQHGLVKK